MSLHSEMFSTLISLLTISQLVSLIHCDGGHEGTTISGNDVDNDIFVMSNSSELRKHSQLEEAANLMFDEYWQLKLLEDPESATVLGDHRYDDRLTSYSLKAYEKKKVMMNEFLERANQMLPFAPEGCSAQNNLQLFIANLQNELDNLMSGEYLFPVSKLHTPEMTMRYLLKYTKLNDTKQYWNLISRYRAMTQQIDEMIELMREGIRTNFTLSNYSLNSTPKHWNQSLENSLFFKPFLNISTSVSSEEAVEIQGNATDAVLNYLFPAFQKLEDFMANEYRENTRPGEGVGSLPGGKEFYQQRLTYHLTDNSVSADDIHAMGLVEVSRIVMEMNEIIEHLGYNMSHKEFNEYLRNDESQHFNTEEEVLQAYRDVLENEIPPKLEQVFKFIPQKKLLVEKVPNEIASGPQAYYLMPSPDNSTPGTFFLDTSDLKNAKYDVMTLAMHEGIPGHHFQFSYIMEQEDLPDFRKYGFNSNAFIEGWALYAEYLGYELGLYEDPYLRFGHLSYEMFRACRLVVDTGIHVLGWTRQQAIDYMMDNLAFTLDHVVREVDRYITWPGQACSYKYGELKIKELRKKAEDALGAAFDVKEFHDIVLRNNGPLGIVEDQINRYITSNIAQSLESS